MASINNVDINTALDIWRLDDGYKSINSYLADADYLFHRAGSDIVILNDVEYSTRKVIDVLIENMKVAENNEFITYYRGGSKKSQKNFFKNNFISVTEDEEQAGAFVDGDCCLYKITVAPDVKRINTGIENETLLERGLYWEYLGKNQNYHIAKISKTPQPAAAEEAASEKSGPQESASQKPSSRKSLSATSMKDAVEDYLEEVRALDDKATPEGLIEYVNENTSDNYVLSMTKAVSLLKNNAGNPIKKRKTKKRKPKNRRKPKTVEKLKNRRKTKKR